MQTKNDCLLLDMFSMGNDLIKESINFVLTKWKRHDSA